MLLPTASSSAFETGIAVGECQNRVDANISGATRRDRTIGATRHMQDDINRRVSSLGERRVDAILRIVKQVEFIASAAMKIGEPQNLWRG